MKLWYKKVLYLTVVLISSIAFSVHCFAGGDSLSTAQSIDLDSTVTSTITNDNWSFTSEYYSFSLDDNSVVYFEIITGGHLEKLSLFLYDEEGYKIEVENGANFSTDDSANWGYQTGSQYMALNAGTYYIEVYNSGTSTGDGYGNRKTVTYDLIVNTVAIQTADQKIASFENDYLSKALPIELGNYCFSVATNNKHYYSFAVSEKGKITMQTDVLAKNGHVFFSLYDPDGNTISSYGQDYGETGANEYSLEPGTYYISVEAYKRSRYTIQLDTAEKPYENETVMTDEEDTLEDRNDLEENGSDIGDIETIDEQEQTDYHTEAKENVWTCYSCGEINNGNFCSNCGSENPARVQTEQDNTEQFFETEGRDVLEQYADLMQENTFDVYIASSGIERGYEGKEYLSIEVRNFSGDAIIDFTVTVMALSADNSQYTVFEETMLESDPEHVVYDRGRIAESIDLPGFADYALAYVSAYTTIDGAVFENADITNAFYTLSVEEIDLNPDEYDEIVARGDSYYVCKKTFADFSSSTTMYGMYDAVSGEWVVEYEEVPLFSGGDSVSAIRYLGEGVFYSTVAGYSHYAVFMVAGQQDYLYLNRTFRTQGRFKNGQISGLLEKGFDTDYVLVDKNGDTTLISHCGTVASILEQNEEAMAFTSYENNEDVSLVYVNDTGVRFEFPNEYRKLFDDNEYWTETNSHSGFYEIRNGEFSINNMRGKDGEFYYAVYDLSGNVVQEPTRCEY